MPHLSQEDGGAPDPRSSGSRAPADCADRAPDFATELNPEQCAAATAGDGPLLIIAGAGTGKTRTLVYRVAHLIAGGVRPDRILLLTFTRRAAQEMLRRAERLVGSASSRVHGGTFHATGHRLLRVHGPAAGLPRDFSIMDQGDAEDLMGLSRVQLGFGQKGKRFPRKETLQHVYSRHINTELPVEEILREWYPQFTEYSDDFARIFADYTTRKSGRNLVDYDDLLLFWALMLEGSEELSRRISGAYDHVLVDEYQDTNLLQARIIRGMCGSHGKVTVVGDDAQSIYSFRGASFRNILEFPDQFRDTRVVTLEQNYRSTQPILDVTNTLISHAQERFTKNLRTARRGGEAPLLVTARDEQQQTRYVVDRILELHESGVPLREIAVLFRAGYMSADLEIELTNRKIPFEKWGGLKFLEAAHVKDVLAFLRVLDNPRDEVSWYRILMLLPGVGDATARAMIAGLAERAWDPAAFSALSVPRRAAESHGHLAALLAALRETNGSAHVRNGRAGAARGAEKRRARQAGGGSAGAEIAAIRELYDDVLRERYDRPEPRLADLDQLEAIAGAYPDRSAFLSAIALEPPEATQDLAGGRDSEDDVLILSTAHSAKGKEWEAVFLIWALDGWFPSARAAADEEQLEEERRLMYVALTRARNHLAVVHPVNAYSSRMSADYSFGQVSRFIDHGVRSRMQRLVLRDDDIAGSAQQSGSDAVKQMLDLRGMLRRRFGAS